MKLTENIKKFGKNILDLVFPISCLACGLEQTHLCASCQTKLNRVEKQACIACQQPAPFGKTHPNCLTKNIVDGALCALSYKDKNVERVIEAFKYNFVSELSKPLAELMMETVRRQELSDYFKDFIIIPVPLHPRRFNWRGFNQAELLIQSLSERLNIPQDLKLVIRSKFTQPQVKLSAEERKRNLNNAFTVLGNPAGKKILIVDDVITSGSTINELAKILKRSGANEVWALCAAHG